MNVWAGVVRVSFVGARAGDSFHADEEQVTDIERAIAAMPAGNRLDLLPAELDVSGGLPLEQRPSLLAAVEGVERGEYSGIIVAYLSRLGRSVREQLRAWDRVEAAGGRIVVVREGIDTRTAHGRMVRTMLLAIAEHERETHGERFEERCRLATASGIWQRRQTPTGYTRDPDTRRLVPDAQAGQVRQAYADRAAGRPLVQIAEALGMTTSGARQLLKNRVYLGELRVRSYVNLDAHPPIIDRDAWDAAQVTVSRPPRSGVPVLLAGIVRCAGCGHMMSRSGRAYACGVRHSGTRCPEPAGITTHILDEHVERIALRELARLDAASAERTNAVQEARERTDEARAELAAYLDAVSAADVGAEAFGVGARRRRDDLEDALEHERRARPVSAAIGGDVVKEWGGLSVQEKNLLLRGLLEVVVVRRVGRGRVVPPGERVRVIAAGHGYESPAPGGGVGFGLLGFWPDSVAEGVLGMPGGEDCAPRAPG